ncbi:MAG: AAA family ATPase [bacterium]|nr:AAA family ATPase [bacterium]
MKYNQYIDFEELKMIQLPGYGVTEEIYKSSNSTIYRGIRDEDNKPVVIKLLNKEYPTSEHLARFRREYEITRSLEGDRIIRVYSLEKYKNSVVILLEDFGGESLEKLLPIQQPNMEEKLSLAIQMTEALRQVHVQNIMHKDINPSNFVWNRETSQVKIIDFGISTELSRENPEVRNPNVLEGTLNYISPEQTGRMNRAMDYRTDMYSLGVLLYELFTGELPFQTGDAMEMVHSHIARTPEPPNSLNPEVPAPLSDIVMKLLSKTAEGRYQNTRGLKSDLEHCREQLASKGTIDLFEIGEHDISGRFQIPQKLYGREEEIFTLLSAFDRVNKGSKEIMLVAGEPGIGKSVLVYEVNKPITEKRGNFIVGKFDQFQRDIPYSALICAFQELVKNLLAERDERLAVWKKKLLRALGPSAQVVIDVIPEVELIVGKQPPVQELDPNQARNRFNIVFQNFVGVFPGKDCPLVIFIDDLQWADLPSLQLIEQFLSDIDTRYLLFIGAYRDNEVDASHPLLMTIEELGKTGCSINTITLKPLALDHMNELLSETLLCKPEISSPLAELCEQKTLGNPFFLNQLLYSLYEESFIDFDNRDYIWKYDIVQIREVDITDNVVELMSRKIRKLRQGAQDILKLASCIGNRFDLDTLAVICEKQKIEAAEVLFEALRESLVIPIDDSYKFVSGSSFNAGYKFLHDRIQQAAYSLIEEDQKKEVHLKIGKLLLKNIPEEERDEKIFDIVNQLNKGIELIRDGAQKENLAKLNLLAGQKAKRSAAYKPAGNYFKTGIRLMGKSGWERNYTMQLSLHEEAQEAVYLGADYAESEKFFNLVLLHAGAILDKVRAYEIRIITFTSEGRYREAVDMGLKILKLLGLKIPKNIHKWHIVLELLKCKLALAGKTDEEILSIQNMENPIALARGRILRTISSATLLSKPEFFPLAILKRLYMYNKNGSDPLFTPGAYSGFGLILCSVGDIENGYRFGRLAEPMLAGSNTKKDKTRILLAMNVFIRHWKEHLRETLKPLLAGYESRLETGDLEFASHSIMMYCCGLFLCGINLNEVQKEQYKLLHAIRILEQKFSLDSVNIIYQATLNLTDPGGISARLCGPAFYEDTMIPILQKEGNNTSLIMLYTLKFILSYLGGCYEEALKNIIQGTQYLGSGRSSFMVPFFYCYESLTVLALCKNASFIEKRKYLKKTAKNQRKMRKWAHHAPMNYLHTWHLVEAELARVQGKYHKARGHYTEAIKGANANEYIREEALAYELYAEFLLHMGEEEFAGFTMKKARYCYSIWGAAAKVSNLEKRYPQLLKEPGETKKLRNLLSVTTGRTETAHSQALDFSTILKASYNISREIILDNLLVELMRVAVENAGAERGFIILEKKGTLFVEAEVAAGREETPILNSVPVDEHGGLCHAIVHYTARTREIILLHNASSEGNFTSDPYILKNKSKSILCTAILNRGKLSGLVYLENNLSHSTFTPERLKVLNILSSQAAISIDNARLYENLEEKVKERTVELDELNRKLSEAMKALWGEMELAKKIQTELLPKNPSMAGFEITAYMDPADSVGGDYYDIVTINGVHWGVIGDVSGHGVPAGLIMMMVQTAIQVYLREHPAVKPSQLLRIVNQVIEYNLEQMKEYKYMTITVFCFKKNGTVRYSGLHQDLLVYRAASGDVEVIESDGIWLAPKLFLKRENIDLEFQLDQGDTLLLYTDGITEAMDKSREMFSGIRLAGILKRTGSLSTGAVKDAVLKELESYQVNDDITMLVLKKT